jgi:hypothetical protein
MAHARGLAFLIALLTLATAAPALADGHYDRDYSYRHYGVRRGYYRGGYYTPRPYHHYRGGGPFYYTPARPYYGYGTRVHCHDHHYHCHHY